MHLFLNPKEGWHLLWKGTKITTILIIETNHLFNPPSVFLKVSEAVDSCMPAWSSFYIPAFTNGSNLRLCIYDLPQESVLGLLLTRYTIIMVWAQCKRRTRGDDTAFQFSMNRSGWAKIQVAYFELKDKSKNLKLGWLKSW